MRRPFPNLQPADLPGPTLSIQLLHHVYVPAEIHWGQSAAGRKRTSSVLPKFCKRVFIPPVLMATAQVTKITPALLMVVVAIYHSSEGPSVVCELCWIAVNGSTELAACSSVPGRTVWLLLFCTTWCSTCFYFIQPGGYGDSVGLLLQADCGLTLMRPSFCF